eukprot:CAMPEP_0179864798 /NCGR_PEP_ID=MMETSP0982-20121206/16404_1 /TAXON_ID=483367 /ORGANISM="non described non described, Strain CCMP 2436" /LENGTH=39 /DNA_ID= /DNA_START= /DNA_END= /DNA_ORIENTATION=
MRSSRLFDHCDLGDLAELALAQVGALAGGRLGRLGESCG